MPKVSGYETADVRLTRQQRRKDNGPGPRKLPRKLVGFADKVSPVYSSHDPLDAYWICISCSWVVGG